MVGKYKVVTLCGSTRFKEQFMDAQKRLTLAGYIVISVGLFGHAGDQEVWDGMDEGTLSKTKEMLDDMHKRKIDMADEIYVINVGGYIKELGRQVSNYDESRWNGMRQILVYEGLLAKFEQNEDLKAQLKSTGDAILAECAVKDHIWGIGLSMKDPDRLDVKKWHGTNLLGYALMIVRERV